MKAVILAGGAGTRISEETQLKPKPMVEIGGRPLLWHIMKIYSAHGINDFVICLGYRGYVIKEYFANYFLHMSDVTFDMAANRMEVHERHAEPWRVTLVDTGDVSQTGGRLGRVRKYVVAARRRNFAYLAARLRGCEEFLVLPEGTANSEPSWFGFLITLRENAPCSRVDLLRYLDQNKVGTRLLFAGNVTRQPYMRGRNFRVSGNLKIADIITANSFWIGVYLGLTSDMLDHAADRIGEFLGVEF